MKKIAFSGTLDPITNGHMWVIGEARSMAEEVSFSFVRALQGPVYDHAQHEISNEEASARLWIDSKLDTQDADGAADLIRATDHFQASSVEHKFKDVMLGADLAILGQEDEVYDAYAQAIRREYSHVPQAVYNEHRCKALVQLRGKAQANALYADAYFAEQYNDRAIANMAREIAGLGGGGMV